MTTLTPTRSALLELQAEQRVMHEGYSFLDEKRLLLAGEILRQLDHYQKAMAELNERLQVASLSLHTAVGRHGLQGVQCYPAAQLDAEGLETRERVLLGVTLQEALWEAEALPAPPAVNPSPEAEACREAFLEIIGRCAALAALASNLERLRREYRRTQRRARALENVLLPEMDRTIRDLDERLEELDREDALLARHGT